MRNKVEMGLCQLSCGHIHARIHPETPRPPQPPIANKTTTCTTPDTTPHIRCQITETTSDGRIAPTRRTRNKTNPTNRRRHSLLCLSSGCHRPCRPINTGSRTNNGHQADEQQSHTTARLPCYTSKRDDSISGVEHATEHAFRRILPL